MKFDERNQFFFKSPFFISMATVESLTNRLRFFLAYLIQLDVDVTGNITAKLCEVGSEFNIFCTLVTMATAAILNLFTPPPKAVTLRWIFLQSFIKFDERNPFFFKSLLFCFHGYCGKVPLDVNVVPIKFHQFLLTCYDHFCVFQFFSILAVSMATAAILKKSTLKSTTSHGI